jgi:hypothetical protein
VYSGARAFLAATTGPAAEGLLSDIGLNLSALAKNVNFLLRHFYLTHQQILD